jgi:Flp pilus assembly protein TadG
MRLGEALETSEARRCDRGSNAVELALLLPILILLLFGIIEFGRGYNAKITLTHAARESVRVYSLDTGDHVAAAQTAAGGLPVSVTTTGGPCSDGNNDPVSVTVAHSLSYSIPFFASGDWNLAETATMRCGG